jgi:hypothetical protein
MAETKKFLSSDAAGFDDKQYVEAAKAGNIVADASAAQLWVAPFAGKITDVNLALGTNGVDGSNPLDLKATVKKNGTAVATTDPDIAKAAGTGSKSTFAAATGITQAVLKTDGTATFAKGDILTVDWDITRTNTPSTEIADATVIVTIKPFAA